MKEDQKRIFKISSKLIKEKQDQAIGKKSHIPFRLNFLFFVVFGLFVALLIQLAYLQIANGSYFEKKIEWSQKTIVEGNAPRGMIYDAKGNVLVGNQGNQAILYTKKDGMKADEMRQVAEKIVALIDIEVEKLTERDKKDFWLASKENLETAQGRLTAQDQINEKGEPLDGGALYQQTVDKVSAAEITFDDPSLKAATVFKRINGAYAMTPVYIKNKNVTPEEIAIIGEHTVDLPGIETGMDWERDYPKGDALKSILGIVSSEKTGLPEEESAAYLAKGYARNDRVGLSYLEKNYEALLKGTKSQSEVITNKETAEIESNTKVYEGEKGKNLVLTIDLDFQKTITKILEDNYRILINNGKAAYSEGIYAVVMNPTTGEVNAMAGIEKEKETGKLKDDTLGTINKAFTPGSVVKPATIMAGYRNGVLAGNETLTDEVIQIDNDPIKKSVMTWGVTPLTAIDALRVSSNVYMMKIAFKLMGETYSPGMTLGDHSDVFEKLRNTYQDFGLGAATGIDLPGESLGMSPKNHYELDGSLIHGRMGNLLDLSYGNFDTYTPMQLAQYTAAIANDGQKVAPHVVEGIYGNAPDGGLGELEKKIEPTIMANIGTPEELSIIQEGMYQVVNAGGGTGAGMSGTKYTASGKTGTAEVPRIHPNNPKDSLNLIHSTMIAYAPSDKPKVAVSLVIPDITDEKDLLNTKITREILDAYYDFYEK